MINLYKQKVKDIDNFPRVIRDDYFNLATGKQIIFPDSKDYTKQISQPIPTFDAVSSNFPFIQQEDIPNDILTTFFKEKFGTKQKAFLKDKIFKINERADYFTYCIYNAIHFLKQEGHLSVITSNAWLGKEYGFQFKKFLLDNFHTKYIVKSNAEHWFSDSKVSTIYSVFQQCNNDEPTKFVTVNFKLEEYFEQENTEIQLRQIEDFYSDIDSCSDAKNKNWKKDTTFENLYHRLDGLVSVSIVSKKDLSNSITTKENWNTFFISSKFSEKFDNQIIQLYPEIIHAFRGARTGWNEMFVIPKKEIKKSGIENKFLIPYVKSSTELTKLELDGNYENYLFVCDMALDRLKENYKGTYNWISKFRDVKNSNGTKTIEDICVGNKPFWYSLRAKKASIVTAINPFERFFFTYSDTPFTIDQRLVAITVKEGNDIELITALLNSIITFLTIEMRGTSRNLGALDLNANYFKSLKVLDPNKLTNKAKQEIKTAFRPLKNREIGVIHDELKSKDRLNFDKVVLKAFGIDDKIIPSLYQILSSAVMDRVTLKEK